MLLALQKNLPDEALIGSLYLTTVLVSGACNLIGQVWSAIKTYPTAPVRRSPNFNQSDIQLVPLQHRRAFAGGNQCCEDTNVS